MTRTAVVLFGRDLRAHDHPALAAARRECDPVVPPFVLAERLLARSAKRAFLHEPLAELQTALGLVVVTGDPVEEAARFHPDAVYLSGDVSAHARRRTARLSERCAAHFMQHLLDGDVASKSGNWQWVAGTGTDTRPNRAFNPTRQGRLHDPEGDYVRTWLPELASLPAARTHDPTPAERHALHDPDPIRGKELAA